MTLVSEPLKEIAVVVLSLPDGRIVLQRRTYDAPVAPGKLGLFGGHIEGQETPLEAIKRELAEETSLNVNDLSFSGGDKVLLPATVNYGKDRLFYVFETAINSDNFKVFEGVGAESYSREELLKRTDISETVRRVLENA